jgi:hypothetical protein
MGKSRGWTSQLSSQVRVAVGFVGSYQPIICLAVSTGRGLREHYHRSKHFRGSDKSERPTLDPVWCGSHSSSQPTFKGAYGSKGVGITRDRKVVGTDAVDNQ